MNDIIYKHSDVLYKKLKMNKNIEIIISVVENKMVILFVIREYSSVVYP